MTSFQRAAELQVLLEGVPLPATRRELIDYASTRSGGDGFLADLERLPDREFRSLDDVGEALVPVQPSRAHRAPEPREESGQPPGGPDYLQPNPTPGAVRGD